MDGDTIDVLHNGKSVRVRLYGIDCPEKKQPYGKKAKRFTSDLAFKKIVTVIVKDRDRYGRMIGEVILPNGKSLNRELIKSRLCLVVLQIRPQGYGTYDPSGCFEGIKNGIVG